MARPILSNVPDNEDVTKGFLRELLDVVFEKYPILRGYMPAFLSVISQYIPSNIIDNFHDFEKILNEFMKIYHSNLSDQEKVMSVKKLLPENTLSDADIYELFKMLDNAMKMINANVSKYNDQHNEAENSSLNKNLIELLNTQNDNDNDNDNDNISQTSNVSSENFNTTSLKDIMDDLKKQITEKTSNVPEKKNMDNHSNIDLSKLVEAYKTHFQNSDNKVLDLSGNIGEIMIRTPDDREVSLNSKEGFELILCYTQKCINTLENPQFNQIGGSGEEKPGNAPGNAPGNKDVDRFPFKESEESLKKQAGFMQNVNEKQETDEVDSDKYVPAEIGGAGKHLENDRVLYRFQYDILNKKLNILSRLLIALSAVPVFGWFFDVLLIIYAFFTKDFKLAIYTIIGTLSVIGREFSKALYILDEEQQMKKALTNPSYARFNIASNDSSYVKKTTPEIINGEYVLVDEDNNIYSPVISKQEKIGRLSTDKSRVHFFNSPPPQPFMDANKDSLKDISKSRTNFIDSFRKILNKNNLNIKFERPSEETGGETGGNTGGETGGNTN